MYKLPNDPVISAPLRTAIGKHRGALAHTRPDDLIAFVINQVINKASIDGSLLEEVIIGCANQAGEDNRNIARMAVLLTNFGVHIPAITLNRLCSSGLDAIIDAARRIITGESSLLFAGGVESMTRAPWVMPKASRAFDIAPKIFDSSLGWRFFNEKLLKITPPEANGVTAERLADKFDISRLAQDEFALSSHTKALSAQSLGYFNNEIAPIVSNNLVFDKDESIRSDNSLEKLSLLKAVFRENGSVTAGNSSSLNDGAAGMIISSLARAKELGLKPLARIIGFASAGLDPKEMGIGPVLSTNKLLSNYKLTINDFDSIEINEAFAAQVLAVIKELKINLEKVNPYGGAIALGHPLGASGARIVITLLNYLVKNNKQLGLASLCVGVGQGVSMAVEMI